MGNLKIKCPADCAGNIMRHEPSNGHVYSTIENWITNCLVKAYHLFGS